MCRQQCSSEKCRWAGNLAGRRGRQRSRGPGVEQGQVGQQVGQCWHKKQRPAGGQAQAHQRLPAVQPGGVSRGRGVGDGARSAQGSASVQVAAAGAAGMARFKKRVRRASASAATPPLSARAACWPASPRRGRGPAWERAFCSVVMQFAFCISLSQVDMCWLGCKIPAYCLCWLLPLLL